MPSQKDPCETEAEGDSIEVEQMIWKWLMVLAWECIFEIPHKGTVYPSQKYFKTAMRKCLK